MNWRLFVCFLLGHKLPLLPSLMPAYGHCRRCGDIVLRTPLGGGKWL